jgi:hypothetical protein
MIYNIHIYDIIIYSNIYIYIYPARCGQALRPSSCTPLRLCMATWEGLKVRLLRP